MMFIKDKKYWHLMVWFRNKFHHDLPEIPAEQWYQFFMAGRMSVICEMEVPKVLTEKLSEAKEMLQG